jgi:hypothetical protein
VRHVGKHGSYKNNKSRTPALELRYYKFSASAVYCLYNFTVGIAGKHFPAHLSLSSGLYASSLMMRSTQSGDTCGTSLVIPEPSCEYKDK